MANITRQIHTDDKKRRSFLALHFFAGDLRRLVNKKFIPEVVMSSDLMTICEQKKLFKIDGEKIWKWTEVKVSSLQSVEQKNIRCAHCHGRVRVHKQQVEHGPMDHVEHLAKIDSENCKGGHYFKGEHHMSSLPVE